MIVVGGRGRDRTGDPLLAKLGEENTKCFDWCRLHEKINEIPALQMSRTCTEDSGIGFLALLVNGQKIFGSKWYRRRAGAPSHETEIYASGGFVGLGF